MTHGDEEQPSTTAQGNMDAEQFQSSHTAQQQESTQQQEQQENSHRTPSRAESAVAPEDARSASYGTPKGDFLKKKPTPVNYGNLLIKLLLLPETQETDKNRVHGIY